MTLIREILPKHKSMEPIPEAVESGDHFDYQPRKAKESDGYATSDSAGVKRVYLKAANAMAPSHSRSSQAIYPFYAEFIAKIKLRNFVAIEKMLKEQPEEFYG